MQRTDLRRVAVVLGSGEIGDPSVLPRVDAVFACNDAAADFPGELAAFVTLHPEKLPMWLDRRRALGLPPPRKVVAHESAAHVTHRVNYQWRGMSGSGSSGLFTAKVALEADPDWRVVLCGVPMDSKPTHYTESKFHDERAMFTKAWHEAIPHLRDRVRSLSGWTRELLGYPDTLWFA